MRILDRAEFLKQPAGIFYAKGRPWAFDTLCIKGETTKSGNDWLYLNPCWVAAKDSNEAFDRLETMLSGGTSFPGDDAYGRDGMFDVDAIFLVFELADLTALRAFVDAAIAGIARITA